jgi:hypothetical protein
MTTVYREKYRCSLCGKKTEYTCIMSTNTFGGSPDLDTRPPKSKRQTIFAWVQRCPKCRYCAWDISTARPEAQAVIIGQEYKDQLNDPAYPELAASFLCKAILDRETKEFAAATWALIHAAWVCDDSDQREKAMACRRKAADMLLIAEEHNQQVARPDGVGTAILVDLLRRSGQPEQARKTIEARRSIITEDMVARIMDFETDLLNRNDIACHTIAELSIPGKARRPMRKVGKESNTSKRKQKVSSTESSSEPSAPSSKAKRK